MGPLDDGQLIDPMAADDVHIPVAVGIVVGLLASFVQSLGLTIQRKSHVLNEQLPEELQRVEHRRPYVPHPLLFSDFSVNVYRLWLLGFGAYDNEKKNRHQSNSFALQASSFLPTSLDLSFKSPHYRSSSSRPLVLSLFSGMHSLQEFFSETSFHHGCS